MSETAYSYQAPDRRVYDMLTGGQNRFGLLPQVEAYYQAQFENMGQKDSNRIKVLVHINRIWHVLRV